MAEANQESLADLIHRVSFHYPEDLDFTQDDADSLQEIVRRLTDAAFSFNLLAITEFGGRSGREREPGLVGLKIGAAFQTWDGEDLHPDPFDKAAVLLYGIVRGHPFEDGNKRTGFLVTFFYLEKIGYPPVGDLPEQDVVDFCLGLSKGYFTDLGYIKNVILLFWGYVPEETDEDDPFFL